MSGTEFRERNRLARSPVVYKHFGTTLSLWAARFNGWSMVPLLLALLALAWPAAYLLIHERRRRIAL